MGRRQADGVGFDAERDRAYAGIFAIADREGNSDYAGKRANSDVCDGRRIRKQICGGYVGNFGSGACEEGGASGEDDAGSRPGINGCGDAAFALRESKSWREKRRHFDRVAIRIVGNFWTGWRRERKFAIHFANAVAVPAQAYGGAHEYRPGARVARSESSAILFGDHVRVRGSGGQTEYGSGAISFEEHEVRRRAEQGIWHQGLRAGTGQGFGVDGLENEVASAG